jgi:hypothetical protein
VAVRQVPRIVLSANFASEAAELFPVSGVTTDDGLRGSSSNKLGQELECEAFFHPVLHLNSD